MFITISDFGARKRNHLKPYTCSLIFPTPPGQRSNLPPREGLTCQIPHSPVTENSQMPEVSRAAGLLKFRFDRRIISQRAEGSMIRYTIFILKLFQRSHKAFKNDFGYVLTIVIHCIPGKNRFICCRSKALLLSLCFHGI